jgi:hypothetical protein
MRFFTKWERKEAISPFDDFALYPHGFFFSLPFFCYSSHYEEEVSDDLHIYFNKHTDYHEQSIERGRQMNIHSIMTVNED